MDGRKKIIFVILGIASLFFLHHLGIFDFFGIKKNVFLFNSKCADMSIFNKIDILFSDGSRKKGIYLMEKGKVTNFSFPDWYGKDRMDIYYENNKISTHGFNDFKIPSYHKVLYSLNIESCKDSILILSWQLFSLKNTAKGMDTIKLNR
jgi:hypothetical protein